MELVTEYLIIVDKEKSDATYVYCDTVEAFNKMVSIHADLVISPEEIKYRDNLALGYEIRKGDIEGKEQRYFHVKVIFTDDEARIGENSAALQAIRTGIYKLTRDVRTLRDDVAFYYATKAYPLIFNVENLMRRLITYFMLTNVGINWPDETSALIKNILEDATKRRDTENILNNVDFIVLKDYLFKPYPSKDTSDLYDLLKKAQNLEDLDLAALKEFRPKSNWERYFSEIVDCDDSYLDSRWKELYVLRCLVAHSATVTKGNFERITLLVNEVSAPLNRAINNLNRVHVPVEEKEQIFNYVPVSATIREAGYKRDRLLPPIAELYQNNRNRIMTNLGVNTLLPLLHADKMNRVITNPGGNTVWPLLHSLNRTLVPQSLRGYRFNPDINVEIQPKYSKDLPEGRGLDEIEIEVIQFESEAVTDEFEDEDEEDVPRLEGSIFEFDPFPLTIRTPFNYSNEVAHKVRKPTPDEWAEWAEDIKRTRRYFTPDEIAKENIDRAEDEKATEIFRPTYHELTASERLYDKIIIENAGLKLTEADEFPLEEFRKLDFDTIKEIPFYLKSKVVTRLYECYCWVPRIENAVEGEVSVYQKIPQGPDSTIVLHTLRSPTTQESRDFRWGVIKGRFSENDESEEVIELKLDLEIANELYDRLLLKIDNAATDGELFTDANRDKFLSEINAVYKFRVIEALLNVNAWNFKIDDTILG